MIFLNVGCFEVIILDYFPTIILYIFQTRLCTLLQFTLYSLACTSRLANELHLIDVAIKGLMAVTGLPIDRTSSGTLKAYYMAPGQPTETSQRHPPLKVTDTTKTWQRLLFNWRGLHFLKTVFQRRYSSHFQINKIDFINLFSI